MLGTLYGIGVGPGDPELLTIKAVKALKQVEHVFAAASTKNDYSLAHEIVRTHLPPNTPLDQLAFPMTFDADHLEDAWLANCEKVIEVLKQGRHAAFLTLGDPLTFSTFIYLMRKIRKQLPEATIIAIPGITAFQAAASCALVPLAEGEEVLTIISGAKGAGRLRDVVQFSDSVVLMKTYKHFPQILDQIQEVGLKENCCFISRCGLEGEIIEQDFERLSRFKQPHYLSLMIVKKRGLETKEAEAKL